MDQKFWAKVDTTGNCWLWTGCLNNMGYGQLTRRSAGESSRHLAHRFAYQELVGVIPEGMVLDHLCKVSACVNPSHLEPVTQAENIRRGNACRATKTHCANGHEWADGNVYLFQRRGGIEKQCRTCRNQASRKSITKTKVA